jgi:hypothetical protein
MQAQKTWEKILDYQLKKLVEVEGLTLVSRSYINKKPDFTLGVNGGWIHNGYEEIEFKLKCPAIMDCNPSNKTSAYKLNNNSRIITNNNHELTFMFPRGYPEDSVKWAFFFTSPPPMYPNIVNASIDSGLNVFNNNPPRGGGDMNGVICIGSATSDTKMHALVNQLRGYLVMENETEFKLKGQDGTNDGGFDLDLMEHFTMNYEVLKKAVYSNRRRLGEKGKRRKLGER